MTTAQPTAASILARGAPSAASIASKAIAASPSASPTPDNNNNNNNNVNGLSASASFTSLENTDPELLEFQPITKVQLDSSVVLKILKHCRDLHPSGATGQLLGVDVKGTLEISNCFPFTARYAAANATNASAEDDTSSNMLAAALNAKDDGTEVQIQMLKCLQKLNLHANVAGYYQSFPLADYYSLNTIETLANYQKTFPWSILLAYDSSRTMETGNLCLKAYRLSSKFMQLYTKDKKFNLANLQKHKFTASQIFDKIPVEITNSHLVTCFLQQLQASTVYPATFATCHLNQPSSSFNRSMTIPSVNPLTPNMDTLELSSESFLETQLEYLTDCLDDHDNEHRKFQNWQRNIQKEHQKLQYGINRRRQENAARTSQGLEPLHDEEALVDLLVTPIASLSVEKHGALISTLNPHLNRLLNNEPSRLENLLIEKQMDSVCKQMNMFAGPALTKMYLAKAMQE